MVPCAELAEGVAGLKGKVNSVMHLDEEVKPVAQKPLVLNWGHAVEPLEEEFLLLGGRWKHALRLNGYRALRQAQRAIRGSGYRV